MLTTNPMDRLKLLTIWLGTLILTLVWVIFANKIIIPRIPSIVAVQVFQISNIVRNTPKNLYSAFLGIINPLSLKNQLIQCQAQLQELQEKGQALEPNLRNQVLALNYPETGYIVLKTQKRATTDSLIITQDKWLVGLVTYSTEDYCIVKTIMHPDIKFTVYNPRIKRVGTLVHEGQKLIVLDIPATFKIRTNDIFYLLEPKYPADIKVGLVKSVISSPQDPTLKITLKSPVNLAAINNFKIIPPYE